MADSNSGGKQVWVPVIVALITTAGAIIIALISNRVGQATGGAEARATAAIQQATSVAQAEAVQIVITSAPIVITSAPIIITSPPVVVTSPPVVVTSPRR
jgi:hypothetical protein